MKKILLCAIPLILVMAATAGAQPGKMMAMAEELGLSDQQVEQLDNMRFQHQKEMIQLKANLQLARLELKEIMTKAKLDEKAALSKQDKISDIEAGIDRKKLEHKLASRKVLNEEQLAKWNKMRHDDGPRGRHHRGGPGHFMDRGPGMGPGPAPDAPEPPEPPEND